MNIRPVYLEILTVILVTIAAYGVSFALIWLTLGGR